MSAYDVQLPGIVIAGLYKKMVIQGEQEMLETPDKPRVQVPSGTPVEAKAPIEPVMATAVQEPIKPVPPVTGKIAPAETSTVQEAPAGNSPVYKFLGNNRQQVTIIVRFPGEAFLPENHLQLLTKMLGACKLNLGDVAIVNDATQKVDINTLKSQLYPKRLLLFGVAPDETGLPLSFPLFKDQEYAGCTYLYTPSLEELNKETEEGKVLKRKLWESLKKMFNV
jgi:hypothetical protein